MIGDTCVRNGSCHRCWLVLAFLSALAGVAWAQDMPRHRIIIQGLVESEDGRLPNDLIAEIYDVQRQTLVDRAIVNAAGRFEFAHQTDGFYEVRLSSVRGGFLYRETVNVSSAGFPVQIRLPKRLTARPQGGTVSIDQLRHPERAARDPKAQRAKEPGAGFWGRIRKLFKPSSDEH